MLRDRASSSTYAVLATALSLLSACSNLFPWHDPAVRVYISAAVSQCPVASDTTCAVLKPLPTDLQLLAQLSGDTLVGKARLSRATGMSWTEEPVRDEHVLHLKFPPPPKGEKRSIYVLEVVRAETAHDSLLSVASDGGTVVWLNGTLLGASRFPARAVREHQDLYTAPLRAGRNFLLYRVLDNGVDAQLHREWHAQAALPDLLAASIDLGAYTTLVRTPLLPDSATVIPLRSPQVRLRSGPVVRFRWRTLLGDSLAEAGEYPGIYPDALPLPARFQGSAVLRTEVVDPASGQRMYLEECPIFADSTAQRLARTLVAETNSSDPVRTARVEAVRAFFNLRPGGPANIGGWLKVQALASLYRHVRQPADFQRYSGPQVWGYRADDGSVQPYWLTVPAAPGALPGHASLQRPGLILSVTHAINSDFWAGRGRGTGFLVHLATLSSSYGNFGVLPHLGGVHDFDTLAVKEVSAITRQLSSVFAIDTAAVGMLVWSGHALEAVQMAHNPRVPLEWLGLAVPDMYHDNRDLTRALDSLYIIRPRLHWLVWQAEQDTVVRRERTEEWVRQVEKKGFDVRYRVVPYSTHLGGYFEDIEADLHRSVTLRFRGANGRAVRDSLPVAAPIPRP